MAGGQKEPVVGTNVRNDEGLPGGRDGGSARLPAQGSGRPTGPGRICRSSSTSETKANGR
ncbi:hypothetical protein [Streptomyces sp. 147326]|uniref:hypothetical protein n=1 Tax=Streptomyces sp. 147326 TaxID=3074379 RepID=UPI0038573D54